MTDAEVKAIMDQNADGFTWGNYDAAPEEVSEMMTTWHRSDGVRAIFMKGGGILTLNDKDELYEMAVLRDKQKQKADAAKKETNGL